MCRPRAKCLQKPLKAACDRQLAPCSGCTARQLVECVARNVRSSRAKKQIQKSALSQCDKRLPTYRKSLRRQQSFQLWQHQVFPWWSICPWPHHNHLQPQPKKSWNSHILWLLASVSWGGKLAMQDQYAQRLRRCTQNLLSVRQPEQHSCILPTVRSSIDSWRETQVNDLVLDMAGTSCFCVHDVSVHQMQEDATDYPTEKCALDLKLLYTFWDDLRPHSCVVQLRGKTRLHSRLQTQICPAIQTYSALEICLRQNPHCQPQYQLVSWPPQGILLSRLVHVQDRRWRALLRRWPPIGSIGTTFSCVQRNMSMACPKMSWVAFAWDSQTIQGATILHDLSKRRPKMSGPVELTNGYDR